MSVLRRFGIFCVVLPMLVTLPSNGQEPSSPKGGKPADRLEQLEKIREKFTPETTPRQYGEQDRITISGQVVTEDGAPLPSGLNIGGVTRRPSYTGSVNAQADQNGRFTTTADFGRVFLSLTTPNYAPVLAGPLETEPGGKIENVRLVLKRGFTAQLRLVSDQGQPVADAVLKTMYLHGEQGAGIHVAPSQTTTDAKGLATLEQAADAPLTVETETPGFQYDQTVLQLKPDSVNVWTLKPARLTVGQVVAQKDQQPLAGAEIRLVQRQGFNPRSYTPQSEHSQPPLLTKTDQEGRFTLNTLRDDCVYGLYITAPDHGGEILSGFRSGQRDLKIELGPPRYVRGTVMGDLNRLERRPVNGQPTPVIRCINPIKLGQVAYHMPLYAPVEMRDGEARFELRNVFPGEVRFELPGQVKTVQVAHAVEDLVLDFSDAKSASPSGDRPQRKVVLRLKTPPGEPPPRGELVVYLSPMNPPGEFQQRTLPIQNGQVEFQAPAPCRMQWHTDDLIGYWIQEESLDLAEAPTPLVKEIEAHPAGAIYGRVLNEDGSPCQKYSYQVAMLNPPPALRMRPHLGINHGMPVDDREGEFVVSPLPLGGTYRLEIQGQGDYSQTRVFSEDLVLSDDSGARQIELRLPRGVTLEGQLTDPLGMPAPGIEIRLGHRHGNRSFSGTPAVTDAAGMFRFLHVNPKLAGEYYLNLQPQQNYRGKQAPVRDPAERQILRLQHGLTLSGQLLEHNSGKIVPGAIVHARPAQPIDPNSYLGSHEARTDNQGRFQFQTLEPLAYRFYVIGMNASQGAPPWEADPRADANIILSGDVQPNSDLTPLAPSSEP